VAGRPDEVADGPDGVASGLDGVGRSRREIEQLALAHALLLAAVWTVERKPLSSPWHGEGYPQTE
jgi:hypothetical protein